MRMATVLRRSLTFFAVLAVLMAITGSAMAAPSTSSAPTLFGAASYNASGVQLTSDSAVAPGYAGIDFPAYAGMPLSSITSLDAAYQMTTGDCNVGSPRFSISLSSGAHIFAYFGDAPDYHCGSSPQSQSNLLNPYVDTGQLPGGTFYDTWSHALTLAGSQTISDLAIVVDGGWSSTQVAEIFSASVNSTTYNFAAPTSKAQCKHGGWQSFMNPGTFKNQGDCVSYVATNGKNGPNG